MLALQLLQLSLVMAHPLHILHQLSHLRGYGFHDMYVKTLYSLSSMTEGSCQLSYVFVVLYKTPLCNGLPGLCNLDDIFGGRASYCAVKLRVTDALVVVSKVGMVSFCIMCSTPTYCIAGALTARVGSGSVLYVPDPRERHT